MKPDGFDWGRYLGLRFVSGGRDASGLDCWGLVRLVYRDGLDVELPSYGEIGAYDLVRVSRAMDRDKDGERWVEAPACALQPFDVCVMRLHGSSRIGHVGVMVDGRRVLHVEEASASVIVPITHFTIRERVACFRRFRLPT